MLIDLIQNITHKIFVDIRIYVALFSILLTFNVNAIISSTSSKMLKEAIDLRESGKNEEAIELLKILNVRFEKHKRIQLELLVNYIKLKQVDNAKKYILKIEGLQLSDEEKKKIIALKIRVKTLDNENKEARVKQESKHKFSSQITAFVGVDEFSSSLSLYDFFDFGDIDDLGVLDDYDNNYLDERNDDVDDKDKTSYSAFQLKIQHRYMSGKTFNFFSMPSRFVWKNNVTLYQKSDNEEYGERYKQTKIDSNFQLLGKDKWLFDFRLRSRFHSINGEKLLSEKSAQLSLSLPVSQDARIKLGFEKRNKSFSQSINFLNASVLTPWVEYTLKFNTHFKVYFGSRYRKNSAEDEFNSYSNLNYYASLRYYHSSRFSAYLTWNDNELIFDIDDPNIVNWGQEDKSSVALGFKYQFNKNFGAGIKMHSVTKNILLYDVEKATDRWKRIEAFISYRF